MNLRNSRKKKRRDQFMRERDEVPTRDDASANIRLYQRHGFEIVSRGSWPDHGLDLLIRGSTWVKSS